MRIVPQTAALVVLGLVGAALANGDSTRPECAEPTGEARVTYDLARKASLAREHEAALDLFRKASRLEPGNLYARLMVGVSLAKLKRIEEAALEYREFAATCSQTEVSRKVSKMMVQYEESMKGNWGRVTDAAVAAYAADLARARSLAADAGVAVRCTTGFAAEASHQMDLAAVAREAGDDKEAVRAVRRAQAADPGAAALWVSLASHLRCIGLNEEAVVYETLAWKHCRIPTRPEHFEQREAEGQKNVP